MMRVILPVSQKAEKNPSFALIWLSIEWSVFSDRVSMMPLLYSVQAVILIDYFEETDKM
jgi:hypothetical protein